MRATKVNAGLAESSGRLLLSIWRDSLHVTWGLTACTPGSAPGPTLGNEYGKNFTFYPHHSVFYRPGALPAAQPTASKHWRHKVKVQLSSSGVMFLAEFVWSCFCKKRYCKPNDMLLKCHLQHMRRDRETGVDTVIYSVTSRHRVRIDEVVDVIVFNVRLNCDLEVSPWCLTQRQLSSVMAAERRRLSPEDLVRLEESLNQHGIVYDHSRT